MSDYLFTPPATTSLPIAGDARRFPVRRIYCVGRNYLDHIRELGNDEKEPPVFFTKPRDAIVQDGETIPYALATQNYHFELELAVGLQSGGMRIAESEALSHVAGYAVALDMTRRDLQRALADKGKPWDVAKGFDHSCPCGPLHLARDVGHIATGRIHLTLNGQTKQDATLDQMIWHVPAIIATLSQQFELAAGDLILTGTPAGVGPVQPGDVLVGEIAGLGTLSTHIGPAP